MKPQLSRLLALLSLSFLMVATLTGCNTVGGLGEDLQILGEKMERKADQVTHGDRY